MAVAVRWVPALVVGALWWWAVVRLLTAPDEAGVLAGTVAAGGWGLSLLPVHVTGPTGPAVTRASRRRRSDAGSDPS